MHSHARPCRARPAHARAPTEQNMFEKDLRDVIKDPSKRRSLDGGHTWLEQQEIAQIPDSNMSDETLYVGSPVYDKKRNTVLMLYKHSGWPFVSSSKDNGVNWTEGMNTSLCSSANPGPGPGLQLASGRLLVPLQAAGGFSGTMFSDDSGNSWTMSQNFGGISEAP